MAKNWMTQLNKGEGAVMGDYLPHNNVIRFPSPSVNFLFGNGHGLPLGYTLVLAGRPKGGKSLLIHSAIGELHKNDPEAWAIKFDTEFREEGQVTDEQVKLWGMDRNRYKAYSTNTPASIFDFIENDVAALCQDGLPLKLVAIDSVNGIQGRRGMSAESVDVQNRGDEAQTLGVGFKRILAVQRKYKFALIMTCQVRAEQDPDVIKRTGSAIKPALPWQLQHYAEYWMMVEPNVYKAGRTDLLGGEFKNEELGDMAGKGDQTAHKIRVKMMDSSMGPKGRTGEFTLDYDHGMINKHEEAFTLGVNRGVIEKVNALTYAFGDKKWTGKPATLAALAEDPALYEAVISEVFKKDQPGSYDDESEDAAA